MHVSVDLRGLHEGDPLVVHEGKGFLEQILAGHEVGVENHEEFTFRDGERAVEISRLGAVVGEPAQIRAAESPGELTDLVGIPVVEDVGAVPPAHLERGAGRAFDYVEGLAVDRDEHVHRGHPVTEQDRPAPGVAGISALALDHGRVEHRLLDRVEIAGPGAPGAGEDDPHRHQGVEDEDRLGGDHEPVGEDVAAVPGIEQEDGVRQNADHRDQCDQPHDGWIHQMRALALGADGVGRHLADALFEAQ